MNSINIGCFPGTHRRRAGASDPVRGGQVWLPACSCCFIRCACAMQDCASGERC